MPVPGPIDVFTAPQTDINHPGRPRTWVQARPHGGYTVGQGRNRISLSRIETDRLVALVSVDSGTELRYTSTTPAKETAQ
jgi:hypothetical protein